MSKEVELTSTPFSIGLESIDAFLQAAKDAFGQYSSLVNIGTYGPQQTGVWTATVSLFGNVGDSIDERVDMFAEAVGPLLLSPFQMQLRTDEMGDDRDSIIYSGPNEESITAFTLECQAREILERLNQMLLHGGPAVLAAIEAIKTFVPATSVPEDTETPRG